jgi:hypothetical protein
MDTASHFLLKEPNLANAARHAQSWISISPVWDANVYEWTEEAIEKGYRGLLTEEFRILKLARDGYITGPGGAPYGSFGPVIICGVAARLN